MLGWFTKKKKDDKDAALEAAEKDARLQEGEDKCLRLPVAFATSGVVRKGV